MLQSRGIMVTPRYAFTHQVNFQLSQILEHTYQFLPVRLILLIIELTPQVLGRQSTLPNSQLLNHQGELTHRIPRRRTLCQHRCSPTDDPPEVVRLHQRSEEGAICIGDKRRILEGWRRVFSGGTGGGFTTCSEVGFRTGEKSGYVGGGKGDGGVRAGVKLVLAVKHPLRISMLVRLLFASLKLPSQHTRVLLADSARIISSGVAFSMRYVSSRCNCINAAMRIEIPMLIYNVSTTTTS